MGLRLTLAAAAALLVAAPAVADNGQRFDYGAQSRAYATDFRPEHQQCFSGTSIVGANRAGSTVYVQSSGGMVYDLTLSGDCKALAKAEKLSVRASPNGPVCLNRPADLVVQTAQGPQICRVSDVRRVGAGQLKTLASATR